MEVLLYVHMNSMSHILSFVCIIFRRFNKRVFYDLTMYQCTHNALNQQFLYMLKHFNFNCQLTLNICPHLCDQIQ